MMLFAVLSLLFTFPTHASVLGEDGRQELYEISKDWQDLAQATLLFSNTRNIVNVNNQWKTFTGGISLSTSPNFKPLVHPDHRYAKQPIIGDCTGFLVSPDVAVTAAHCLPENGDLSKLNYSILAAGVGYSSEVALKSNPTMIDIPSDRINWIDKVLFVGNPPKEGGVSETDFAIIKLKNPIFSIKPLSLKRHYQAAYQAPVSILGHQLGLPLKADLTGTLAQATDPSAKIILAFLDSGEGNSGGPVFDTQSKSVIGVYVAAGRDWLPCDIDEGSVSGPRHYCEAYRPETVDQLAGDPNVPKKVLKSFRKRYENGVITAWSSRIVRIDAVAEKLTELGIPYTEN